MENRHLDLRHWLDPKKKQSLVRRKVYLPRPHAPALGCAAARVRKHAWRLESASIDWEDYYVNPGEKNTTIPPMTGRGPFADLYPQADSHRDFLYTPPIPTTERHPLKEERDLFNKERGLFKGRRELFSSSRVLSDKTADP